MKTQHRTRAKPFAARVKPTTPPPPKKARIAPVKLDSLRSIKSELSRVYRGMRHGSIAPADGTKLAYVLSQLGALTEQIELEERLSALERLES